MNSKELEDRLVKMTEKEVKDFIGKAGGSYKGKSDISKIVSDFTRHPEREKRYCQLLDLPTEEEKMIQAANESAKGATNTEKWIKYAAVAASISAIASIIALLIILLKK